MAKTVHDRGRSVLLGLAVVCGLTLGAALVVRLAPPSAAAEPAATTSMPGMTHAGMGGDAAAQVAALPPNHVDINEMKFLPTEITVPVGTEVEWDNKDESPHTVVAIDAAKTFKSDALDTGDSFKFTFSKPGTYKYFCTLHPLMVGTVVVK